jgi:ketosteroid isomerase-like protein
MTQITEQITDINQQFDTAFNSKNAAAIAALYTDNAIVMPAPAGAPLQGKDAIQTFSQG